MIKSAIKLLLLSYAGLLATAGCNPQVSTSLGAGPTNNDTQRDAGATSAPSDSDQTNSANPDDPPLPPTPPAPWVPDPLALADGTHVLFVDGYNPNSNDSYTRAQAMDPNTSWKTPRGLRGDDHGSRLHDGDIVLFRGGDYALPMIDVTNRIIIVEKNITLKGYAGESVVIRGSSLSPGGQPMGCNQLCYGVEIMTFIGADGLTIDSLDFKGFVDNSVVNGITGRLYIPRMMTILRCNNVQIRNSSFTDFLGNDDLGYGHRYNGNSYFSSENVYRGLTVWGLQDNTSNVTSGLILDNVHFRCSDSPQKMTTSPYADTLNAIGFITQDISNVIMQNSSLGDCPGNAMEFSTVSRPQSDIVFQNNIVNNTVKNGIQVGGPGLTQALVVRNNRFFGINQYNEGYSADRGYGIRITNSSDVAIYNNLFYDGHLNSSMIILAANPNVDGYVNGNENTRIYNNTFYHAGYRAIYFSNEVDPEGTAPLNLITNSRVYNNLIDQISPEAGANTDATSDQRELMLSFFHFEESGGYGNEFKYNLLVPAHADGKAVGVADSGKWLLNGSLIGSWSCNNDPGPLGCAWVVCGASCGNSRPARYRYTAARFNTMPSSFSWGSPTSIQNNIDATPSTPMFVNPNAGDFHLNASSPAIGAGLHIPEVTTDFDGRTRPSSGSCIGAFEH